MIYRMTFSCGTSYVFYLKVVVLCFECNYSVVFKLYVHTIRIKSSIHWTLEKDLFGQGTAGSSTRDVKFMQRERIKILHAAIMIDAEYFSIVIIINI